MYLSRALPYWRCCLVVAALSTAPAGFAQSASDKPVDPLEKLDAIEKQMNSDRRDVTTLSQKATDLVQEQQRLREQLVVKAQSAQTRERQLNEVEQKLALFETREAATMRALNGERGTLSSLLAVLQRMGREPPPALVVRPDDATAAARSAMLLSAVVPAVQKETGKLSKNLNVLRKLRQQTAEQRLAVAAAAGALEKDRNALSELLAQSRNLAVKTDQELKTRQTRISVLAEQAGDLRALIASLNDDAKRPQFRGTAQVMTTQIATAGAVRTASLDTLRGMLTLPANGELSSLFGSADGLGGRLSGIYLGTRPGSQVTSPCDGKIMFAGPFRGYGQMLIIAANGGYHVLLAGLANIDGVVGQVVLAGEPVGRMGSGRASSRQGMQQRVPVTGNGAERLYIEFRRNGVPVDPVPWFAALREKVSG